MAILFFTFLIFSATSSAASRCNKHTNLTAFESDLFMIQHQLRGRLNITDGCSFSVRNFDMLPGSDNVVFWGAAGDDFVNLTSGHPISSMHLNRTYKNETLHVNLLENITFDQIQVLGVWDLDYYSDFGHAVLPGLSKSDLDSGFDLSPSPSPAPSPEGQSLNFQNRKKGASNKSPTVLDNCRTVSDKFRLRWSLGSDSVAIALEGAVELQKYMAFGWADPKLLSVSMIGADVTMVGFTEDGMPFAEDYYITNYSECLLNKDGQVEGVCPDAVYEASEPSGNVGLVNNSKLTYGHRSDGVSFIKYNRPLASMDKKYDITVKKNENMTVIWAIGMIRPPDLLRPHYLPQNHGGPLYSSFGYFTFNVSQNLDDCIGPLEADNKEDQAIIISDGKTPVVVTTGPAMHYPNPPNPDKVFYINKKEAPLLRVERGVPVTFAIQAGHDVAFYVTSDPIGGNATLRNASEVVYAGGSDAQGVLASPMELVWYPDRNTPDQVYYHSVFEQKMGWKIQVVDGGLSDMYNNSVYLDDQQVSLFWTLPQDSDMISIAVRGEKKSGYVAIGFGGRMVNSYVYVGWVDSTGKGRVDTYWIDGQEATSIHPTKENLTYVRCKSENGIITFEFTRPLNPKCKGRVECKNVIDPSTPLKVVWALGAKWSADNLSIRNMHSATSRKAVQVLWLKGSTEAVEDLRPVLAVHGFMMFVAWGILLPGGIMSARYLRHVKGDQWYQIHVYLQYSGIAITLLGVLFAAAELRGFFVTSVHVKFGLTAIILALVQPINAYIRPKKPANGEVASRNRIIWEYFHVITGRCAIVVGIVALYTGMKHLGHRYGDEDAERLTWALIVWVLIGVVLALYLEYLEVKEKRRDTNSLRGNWVLGNDEEDDSVDLLNANRIVNELELQPAGRTEVQLEPLSR